MRQWRKCTNGIKNINIILIDMTFLTVHMLSCHNSVSLSSVVENLPLMPLLDCAGAWEWPGCLKSRDWLSLPGRAGDSMASAKRTSGLPYLIETDFLRLGLGLLSTGLGKSPWFCQVLVVITELEANTSLRVRFDPPILERDETEEVVDEAEELPIFRVPVVHSWTQAARASPLNIQCTRNMVSPQRAFITQKTISNTSYTLLAAISPIIHAKPRKARMTRAPHTWPEDTWGSPDCWASAGCMRGWVITVAMRAKMMTPTTSKKLMGAMTAT